MRNKTKSSLSALDLDRIQTAIHSIEQSDFREAQAHHDLLLMYIETHDFSNQSVIYLDVLMCLSRYYCNIKDPDKAMKHLQTALDFAIANKLAERINRVKSTIAITHAISGRYMNAIDIWEELLETTEDPTLKQSILNNLVIGYGFTKQFTKAIDLSYQLLELTELDDDKKALITTYLNQGNAYNHAAQLEKALDSYHKALVIAEQIEDHHKICSIMNNICLVLGDLKRIEEALHYANRSLILRLKYFSDANLAVSYNNIGTIHLNDDNPTEALLYFKQALKIYDAGSDNAALTHCHLNLSKSYLAINEINKALEHAKAGEALARDLNLHSLLLFSDKMLSKCYTQKKQYKKALEYTHAHNNLLNQRVTELTENMISKVEADFLRHKLEEQTESYRVQNKELKKSNNLIKKKTREVRKINNDLNNTIEVLNKLISVISHDVRGPVANAALALHMISNGDFDDSSQPDLFVDISDSLDETTDLLTQILLWIESNSFSTGIDKLMRPMDLNPILESIVKMYNNQIKQKQISFRIAFQSHMTVIHSEPNTIKTIFRNIISNAIKFTGMGGAVHIAVMEKDDKILVKITDSGVGMSAEDIQKLYTNKLDSKTGTNEELGLGIGLSLCISYLKLLGAELEVNSILGEGSTFTIKFPKP